MTVSIVIAEALPAIRRGTRAWFDEADFQVVGEAADTSSAVRLLKRYQPDVLVLDAHLSGIPGLDVLDSVRKHSPRTRAVIYSCLRCEHFLVESLRKGALGYVLKASPSHLLVRAVSAAAEGSYFLDSVFSKGPAENYLRDADRLPANPLEVLTTREKEVLHFVAEGASSPDIARRLHLSVRTVEQHRAQLRRKLKLRNQTELVRFAMQHGIISLEQ